MQESIDIRKNEENVARKKGGFVFFLWQTVKRIFELLLIVTSCGCLGMLSLFFYDITFERIWLDILFSGLVLILFFLLGGGVFHRQQRWLFIGAFWILSLFMTLFCFFFSDVWKWNDKNMSGICLEHGGADWDAALEKCIGGSYNLK